MDNSTKRKLARAKKYLLRQFGLSTWKGINSPNEAINLDFNTLYVAIPKTGSSTVRAATRSASDYILPREHLNLRELREAMRLFYLYKGMGSAWEFPELDRKTTEQLLEKADLSFNDLFSFSVVRNPWARAVSLYFRDEGVQPHQTMSFDQFIEQHHCASDTCVVPSRHENQADWLVDESGNIAVDYVGKIEELDVVIDTVREETSGRLEIRHKMLNVNKRSRSTSYRDLYNDYTKKIIVKRFEKDIDLFKYSF
jgi:hypothetical protein